MRNHKLGKIGLEVAAIGFCCMGLSDGHGPATDRGEAIKLIRAAYEPGVTLLRHRGSLGPFINQHAPRAP
jgi:aryl-alcohol dehydrogenase-like predicted oxidoreductase